MRLLLIAIILIAHSSISESQIDSSKNQNSLLESEDVAVNELDEESSDTELTNPVDTKVSFTWLQHPDDHGEYSERALLFRNETRAAEKKAELDSIDPETNPLNTADYVEKEWQLMFRSLDASVNSMFDSPMMSILSKSDILKEIYKNLDIKCKRSFDHLIASAKRHKLWALRMIDSNGKLPSGLTYGRFAAAGDFEECLATNIDEYAPLNSADKSSPIVHHKFHGKYCLIDFRLPMPPKPKNTLLGIHNPVIDFNKTDLPKLMPDIHKYAGYASALYAAGYNHPVCLPSTCDIRDVTKAIGKALEGIYLEIRNEVDCEEKFVEAPLRTSQLITFALFSAIFLTSFAATALYYFLPVSIRELNVDQKVNEKVLESELSKTKSSLSKKLIISSIKNRLFTECFSIQTNFAKLTKPDPRGLTFVHYIRIVAMGLTVITHTAALGTLQAITKPADMRNSDAMFRDLLPQMLANAFNSIQIFFFMAGFMLVVSTFPNVRKQKGKLPFMDFCLKRAIRLWPGLIAAIGVNFIWPLFVEGPTLSYFIRLIVDPCEKTWWHTLGFVSNFDHLEKMCLRHSYFAASDYQLHIMAYPLLLLLYTQPIAALAIAAVLTVCGFIAQVIMVTTKPLMPFMMVDYVDIDAFFNSVHYFHHPVWNHMSAFFYGFIVGYLVSRQIRVNLSEKTINRIWLIIVPVGLCSMFATYFWNHYRRPLLRWQMIMFVIIDRLCVLSMCAWISYGALVLARKRPTAKKNNTEPSSSPSANNNNTPTKPPTTNNTIKDNGKQSKFASNSYYLAPRTIIRSPSDFGNEFGKGIAKINQGGLTPSASSSSLRRLPSCSNLSELDKEDVAQDSVSVELNEPEKQNVFLDVTNSSNLTKTVPLSRQHSSPNFDLTTINEVAELSTQQGNYKPDANINLKSARSSADISQVNISVPLLKLDSPQKSINLSSEVDVKSTMRKNSTTLQSSAVNNESGEAKKPTSTTAATTATPARQTSAICNVNTLCLVFSRLTFQLYLFNMVVLWIDVTHSKYNWHFSYYFIFTKAAAVYLMSAAFAAVFFVCFESPMLSLFLLWTKSRKAANEAAAKQQDNFKQKQHGVDDESVHTTKSTLNPLGCMTATRMVMLNKPTELQTTTANILAKRGSGGLSLKIDNNNGSSTNL